MFFASSCSCFYTIHWYQMLSREWNIFGAAPTNDVPTTSEWSTSLLPTMPLLMLAVWRYIILVKYYTMHIHLADSFLIWGPTSITSLPPWKPDMECLISVHISSLTDISSFSSSQGHYKFAPSQWETSVQSNAVSQWLGANLESALSSSH